MRILVISNLFPPDVLGGYEILCSQVVDALRARGHSVSVLTTGDSRNGIGSDLAVHDGVHRCLELEVPFGQKFRPSRLRRMAVGRSNEKRTAEVIRRVAPELIFLWSLRRLTLGPARAAEASGLPVTWTLNDEFLAGFLPATGNGTLRRWAGAVSDASWSRRETLASVRLDRVTVISRCLRSRLVAQGVPVADAEVISQGPPLESFPRREQTIDRVERCLYVGQLHPDKGVHVAIEAVHRLAAKYPELSLTIVGRGDEVYTRRLHDLAERGPARIFFLGSVRHVEVAAIYRRHDALLFPSIWAEPFGLTHLEAMASGLPVISTGHGGQGELLEDGRTALICPAGDIAAWAWTLRLLVEGPRMARALAENGHRLVTSRLNLERYVDGLEAWLLETWERSRSLKPDDARMAA